MSVVERTARRPSSSVLFSASRRVMILDHFRVPYQVADSRVGPEIECVQLNGNGPAVMWPRAPARYGPRVAARLLRANGARIPIFANIAADRRAASLLACPVLSEKVISLPPASGTPACCHTMISREQRLDGRAGSSTWGLKWAGLDSRGNAICREPPRPGRPAAMPAPKFYRQYADISRHT